jgi:methylmalonyl-CoA epimerase
MSIKVKAVQHIAIATKKSEPLLRSFREIFDIHLEHQEIVAPQKVKTDFLKIAGVPFELLEPTSNDSPISKFLEKRGNAFHHLALEVENIEAAVSFLKSRNIQLINETPTKGAHGMKTVFLHPKSFHGLLIELVENA